MLDELADGVVGAVDLVVLGGKGFEEEGGEGGGGDVLGGEAEDVSDFSARIELGVLSHLKRLVPWCWVVLRESGCRIIRRARNTRELVFPIMLKQIRIPVFEYFTLSCSSMNL